MERTFQQNHKNDADFYRVIDNLGRAGYGKIRRWDSRRIKATRPVAENPKKEPQVYQTGKNWG